MRGPVGRTMWDKLGSANEAEWQTTLKTYTHKSLPWFYLKSNQTMHRAC